MAVFIQQTCVLIGIVGFLVFSTAILLFDNVLCWTEFWSGPMKEDSQVIDRHESVSLFQIEGRVTLNSKCEEKP